MRRIAWESSFRRAFKRRTCNRPALGQRILETIGALAADPFAPSLRAHRLSGELDGLWACTVEYDCRIVFAFEPDPESGEDLIALIDVGSHDDVY